MMHPNYVPIDCTPGEFKNLREKGMTLEAIAKKFNVSYSKLHNWMKEHELVGVTLRPDCLDRRLLKKVYVRMKENGYSDAYIAQLYGTTDRNISRWKKRNNIPKLRVSGVLGKKVKDYEKLRKQGLNDYDILIEWGCGNSTLTKWKKENGLI